MTQSVRHNIIALVYDFDGTLSPNNMQEDTIFPAYGVEKEEIWARADKLVRECGYERTLAYLKILMQDEPFRSRPLSREVLRRLAVNIQYYPGVSSYFAHIGEFLNEIPEARKWGVTVEHYIISSGMKEILEGADIYPIFKKVYACEYDYDAKGPVFPKLVINDTNKTQFLFRICKGKLELNEDINTHTPDEERRIPFRNLVYIGDSLTDIPSMTVVQKSGGCAIAVFDPVKAIPAKVRDMVVERRVDHFAPASFEPEDLLVKIIKTTLKKIVYQIAYEISARMSLDWVQKNRTVPD